MDIYTHTNIQSIPTANRRENKAAAKNFDLKKMNESFLFRRRSSSQFIYYIWDKQAIREKKLYRLTGKEIDFKPGKNSILLFEEDYKYNEFMFDNKRIYQPLKEKYSLNLREVSDLFKELLKQDDKLKCLTPTIFSYANNTSVWNIIPI